MSDDGGQDALDDLVAVMVHDLNNPIAALATNLRFLQTSLGPSMPVDIVETLSDAQMLCDVMRRLVGNLGIVAKPQRPGMKRLAFDVAALAKEVVTRLDKHVTTMELELAFNDATTTATFVECDREMSTRALENLVAFATERATRKSAIVVMVSVEEAPAVHVRFSPRSEPAASTTTVSRSGRLQTEYGRGLTLYCARLGAQMVGGRVDQLRGADGSMTLALVLPGEDKQNA